MYENNEQLAEMLKVDFMLVGTNVYKHVDTLKVFGEIMEWCNGNIEHGYYPTIGFSELKAISHFTIKFDESEDMMHFKLRWIK